MSSLPCQTSAFISVLPRATRHPSRTTNDGCYCTWKIFAPHIVWVRVGLDRNERRLQLLERHQRHRENTRRIRSCPPINLPSSPAPPPASAWNSQDAVPRQVSTLSSRR